MNGSQSVALIDLHTDSINDMKSQRDNTSHRFVEARVNGEEEEEEGDYDDIIHGAFTAMKFYIFQLTDAY